FRSYNGGSGEFPSSVLVMRCKAGWLLGTMYFQFPSGIDKSLSSWVTRTFLPTGELPINAPKIYSLSIVSPAVNGLLSSAAKLAIRSIWQTRALEAPGLTLRGQLTIHGTLVPPSNLLYFPPLKAPAGICPFRWVTAPS